MVCMTWERGSKGTPPSPITHKIPSYPTQCWSGSLMGVCRDKVEEPASEPRGLSPHTTPHPQTVLGFHPSSAAVSSWAGQTQVTFSLQQGHGGDMCLPLHAQDSSCCSLSQKGTHFPSLHLPRSKHTVSSSAFPGGGHSLLLPGSTNKQRPRES